MTDRIIPEGAKLYRTVDLYFAAALVCAGFEMWDPERKSPNRVEFVFMDPAGTYQRVRSDYFSGRLTVDALKFTQNVKSLKSLVHSV